jgi:hypothetical protein
MKATSATACRPAKSINKKASLARGAFSFDGDAFSSEGWVPGSGAATLVAATHSLATLAALLLVALAAGLLLGACCARSFTIALLAALAAFGAALLALLVALLAAAAFVVCHNVLF